MKKLHWIERAKQTQRFHAEQLRNKTNWRLQDTAELLERSIGSVSQDLLVASWCKTHQNQLERFDYLKEALEWIRDKELERMSEVDD